MDEDEIEENKINKNENEYVDGKRARARGILLGLWGGFVINSQGPGVVLSSFTWKLFI